MKVVVNKCFGGFSLSRACFLELFKRGAKIIKKMSFEKANNGKTWPSEDYCPSGVVGWYCYRLGGGLLADSGVYAPRGAEPIYCSTSRGDEHRADPELVALIEEHGAEWASGFCAELEIIEVPDDAEWGISEYDGQEHVAEKHRTW